MATEKSPAFVNARRQLQQALKKGKVAHAYLFTGGDEEARIELAEYLAAVLNCREPSGEEPCGCCRSCRQMAGGNHPDFHLVRPQGATLKIEQIRELERRLALRSFQGGARVAVLVGAETMTEAAANCLLKTLEEPPQGAYLILLAKRPDLLPATIRSRCQELHLKDEEEEAFAGINYWQRLMGADLRAMAQEILPDLEKEEDLKGILEAMSLACRDQLVWQMTGTEKLLLRPEGFLPSSMTPIQLWHCYRLIQECRAAVDHNGNRRLILEALMFNLLEIKKGEVRGDSYGYRRAL
ncbi:hypothetical protein MHOCP_00440 [Moorella humiferrea]|uniref:DNA polymerase III subunit delta' n=1 Tax=Neomoorella humiferrea TaxID=676965 RepID=UPI0030D6002F